MKYIVWIKEAGKWVEQGDGPLTEKTAKRIVKELRHDFPSCAARALPVGEAPR